jgi:hypothetical protein
MLDKIKKAQSAIEFIALIGFVLFFFVAFFSVIQYNQTEKYKEKEKLVVQSIGLDIQQEIDLAAQSSDGYSRTFDVPSNVFGNDYQINITGSLLYLSSENAWVSFYIPNVTGIVKKGYNLIKKQNGFVFIQ